MTRERIIRPPLIPIIHFPRHFVPIRDEIWQAGKASYMRSRRQHEAMH